jgi:MFS family permease
MATHFVTVSLTSIAYIAIFTVAALLAPEQAGWAGASGLPAAFAVGGTALGVSLLAGVNARRGRVAGIRLGLGIATAGAVVCLISALTVSLPLLLIGATGFGFGNAAMQITRYAAADLVGSGQRAGAIATIVWASTVGAVIGPNLVGPAGALGTSLGIPPLTAATAATAAFMFLALAVAMFGPRLPDRPAQAVAVTDPRPSYGARLRELLARPASRAGLITMLAGQLVMTLIMTMTPYHLHTAGHRLETVGFVLSAHTLGMFAVSPISGWLSDRFGERVMAAACFTTLAVAGALAAISPVGGGAALAVPLFLLGVGWNFGFVAGSAMLAGHGHGAEQVHRQGIADTLVWIAAGLASASSGVVVAAFDYATLAVVGTAAAVLLATVVVRDLRAMLPEPAA